MVATALIQRPPGCWIGNAGQPDSAVSLLFFDATLKESHKGKNTITRQPVEQGVDITDNVRPEPDELSLDAIITNAPLTFNGVTFPDSANYASDAYRLLLSLKNSATFLSVSTSLRDYDNMIISSLDVDRDKTTGQVLAVKISFQSVIIVSSQQQPVPVKVSGLTQTQAGTVAPTDATPAQATSLASKITGIGEVANP
jgi:hypothetical protein